MNSIIALIIIAGLIFFWIDSMNAREKAIHAAIKACQDINVQFLDQTVALKTLKPIRNTHGRLTLRRIYTFDFSIHGNERKQGRAIMLGQNLKQVQLDHEEGMIIDDNIKTGG
jgi:hypothetical protein